MTAPRTTLWPLDPHTRAKHEILRYYLDAWIPILSLKTLESSSPPRVQAVDAPARRRQGTYPDRSLRLRFT